LIIFCSKSLKFFYVFQVRVVIDNLGISSAELLLHWLAANKTGGPIPSKHFHFYLILIKELLYKYSKEFKLLIDLNNPSLTAILELLTSQGNLLLGMFVFFFEKYFFGIRGFVYFIPLNNLSTIL